MAFIIRNTGQGGTIRFTNLGLGGMFNSTYISGSGASGGGSITGRPNEGGAGGGGTTPSVSLLLDTYTGAAVAFSLRKLNSSYSGNAIRVRRSNDNVEQDFGFVNNQLDTGSLATFVANNVLTYSEDFSVWATNLSATVNSNVTTDPLGGSTADRFNFASSANSEVYLQPITWQAGTYTVSVYAKSDTKSKFRLKIWNGSTAYTSPDLTATSTWARYSYTVTVTGGTGNFGITNEAAGGTGAVFMWGAQANIGQLQPYQQTAGGAIVRNAFITRWYDQSGNNVTASQATAGNQPRIASNGNIDTQGGKPSIWFVPGASNSFTTTTNVAAGSYMSTFIVSKLDETTGGYKYLASIGAAAASSNFYCVILKAGGGFQDWAGGDAIALGTGYNTGLGPRVISNGNIYNSSYTLSSVFLGSTNTGYYINGNAITTKSLVQGNADSNNTTNPLVIGSGGGTDVHTGYLSELIIYRSNQFANKAGIESNINTNYTIY
jgi:hypothetical protein